MHSLVVVHGREGSGEPSSGSYAAREATASMEEEHVASAGSGDWTDAEAQEEGGLLTSMEASMAAWSQPDTEAYQHIPVESGATDAADFVEEEYVSPDLLREFEVRAH